jgi:dihydrofolate synthase/folylpolyglutamate synthase
MKSLSEWLRWQEKLHPSAIDLGLDRMRRTLARLGWQQPKCPVITVAGTNGKGSTVALASRILGSAGYRVGTFTSPHLLHYNERIVIDGREINDESLVAAFERIDAARGEDTLTFFEFNTLAALLIFDTAGLDAIVLEVGLGGRLDSVNAVAADVAIVTSIALDHTDWLGPDVEGIGREKAGIFRPGRPAIFGSRDMPGSIAEVAQQLGAPLYRLGREFDWSRDPAADRWSWRGRSSSHENLPRPALTGDLQFDNASSVLCALECLSARLPVTREAIECGLTTVTLPGRFQIFRREQPVASEWILDVAHNPAAAQALAGQLTARLVSGRTLAVCGVLGDKDIEGVVSALRGSFDAWIIVGLDSPRAVPLEALSQRLAKAGANVVATADDVAGGCGIAQTMAQAGDRIVVFGSFLTVGPALEWIRAREAPLSHQPDSH